MNGVFGQQGNQTSEATGSGTEITLEKLDAIRNRLNVSYAEARKALVQARGDVVEAVLRLEETLSREAPAAEMPAAKQKPAEDAGKAEAGAGSEQRRVRVPVRKKLLQEGGARKKEWQELKEKMEERGSEVAHRIVETLKRGSAVRFVVRKDDKVLLDVPATVAAVGAIVGPYAAALGVGAALLTRCNIEIRRPEQEEAKGSPDESTPDRSGDEPGLPN